ncbi:NAD(P)-binding domain-containing protein [Pimelobacter simplex]|uniref:NADPH-dependent F420 reductase n=1 Tax=Nocardioides simplex TaxID=2045 RepID=UPI000942BFD4|nr:NAD(P)-binding domain-containing protein [Pimelobacter simplex]MCG8152638.1 NAD(P)-binding domain-containing protein [Pimelobacter simplex]
MTSRETKETHMEIGLLGTGNLAAALGEAWARAGHGVVVAGRDAGRARAAAERIGAAGAVAPAVLGERAEVVVVAVAWDGLDDALALAGGPEGRLAGRTVLDCTNPVDFASGRLLPASGSAAERVAAAVPGAHVVKALHLFAGASWPYEGPSGAAPVVALCGDDPAALGRAGDLVADLGARAAVVGGLDAARQAEEVAGFVMRLVVAGANPRLAVPDVPRGEAQ